jgi:hypothetical protein
MPSGHPTVSVRCKKCTTVKATANTICPNRFCMNHRAPQQGRVDKKRGTRTKAPRAPRQGGTCKKRGAQTKVARNPGKGRMAKQCGTRAKAPEEAPRVRRVSVDGIEMEEVVVQEPVSGEKVCVCTDSPELWCEGALAKLSRSRPGRVGRATILVPKRLLAEPVAWMPREWATSEWANMYS